MTAGTVEVVAPDTGSMDARIGVHMAGQPMSDLTGAESAPFEVEIWLLLEELEGRGGIFAENAARRISELESR